MGQRTVNARQLKETFLNTHRYLSRYVEILNGLNVFPVPDSDTGANVASTIIGAVESTDDGTDDLMSYVADLSEAMLMNSRGCSGVLLSLFCRGVARTITESGLSVESVSRALANGYRNAYENTQNPQEGTMLTLMRALRDRFDELNGGEPDSAGSVQLRRRVNRSIADLWKVLRDTPDMFPLLKEANVVDSGGAAFVVALEGLRVSLLNQLRSDARNGDRSAVVRIADTVSQSISHLKSGVRLRLLSNGANRNGVNADFGFRYCTEVVVEPSKDIPGEELTSRIRACGDSALVVRGGHTWKVHVHTNTPDAVFRIASSYGVIRDTKVDDMRLQHSGLHGDGSVPLICVVDGDGYREILNGLGADAVVAYRGRGPSARQIARAVGDRGQAVVLFDHPEIDEIQQEISRGCRGAIQCIGMRSIAVLIQVLMSTANASAEAIAEAAGSTTVKSFEVFRYRDARHATFETRTRRGRYATVCEGRVICCGDGVLDAACEGVALLRQSESLVTLYLGRGRRHEFLADDMRKFLPELTVEAYRGGQRRSEVVVTLE